MKVVVEQTKSHYQITGLPKNRGKRVTKNCHGCSGIEKSSKMEGSVCCLILLRFLSLDRRILRFSFPEVYSGRKEWHVVTFSLDPKSKVQKVYKQLSP